MSWTTHLWAGAAMSVGWALRGSIGGGPLGAMIPGALWALTLAWRWRISSHAASLLIGLSALGMGLGGQMTYGQTIGLVREEATRAWGVLGLSVKGGVWGLSAAAILWLALARPGKSARLMAIFLGVTHLGWQWINAPKLAYFSNRFVKPREEVWAGLLLSALALLIALPGGRRWWLATAAALSGAVGFGAGSFWNLLGPAWPGWKMMEFSFGFLLGVGMSWAMERVNAPKLLAESGPFRWAWPAFLIAPILVIVGDFEIKLPYAFSVVTAVCAPLLLLRPQWGWGVGFGATMVAACLDLYPIHPKTAIAFALVPTALVAWWQHREEDFNGRAAVLLLSCCCAIYALEYWFNPMRR